MHALCDTGGEVSDSFEIIINFEYCNDEPEIACDGLVEGEDLETFFFNTDFHIIDFFIRLDDFFSEISITLVDGLYGQSKILLDFTGK